MSDHPRPHWLRIDAHCIAASALLLALYHGTGCGYVSPESIGSALRAAGVACDVIDAIEPGDAPGSGDQSAAPAAPADEDVFVGDGCDADCRSILRALGVPE